MKPGSRIFSESALAAGGSKPAGDGADGESIDLVSVGGASCSLDVGSEVAVCLDGPRMGESGKRPLWASEDLSCGLEVRRDLPAASGSPDRTNATDSPRAISLDASECLSEVGNVPGTSLVRSAALEDLTSIGDRSQWVDQAEEPISGEHMKRGLAADYAETLHGEGLNYCGPWDSGANKITPERPHSSQAQRLSYSGFDPVLGYHSEDPQNVCDDSSLMQRNWNFSDRDSIRAKAPSDVVADQNETDATLDSTSYSKSDIINDSEMSDVVQSSSDATPEFRKTPHSSPARKSMVPVAIFKGLFAVIFTNSESVLFS